jgi:hypothetical protein
VSAFEGAYLAPTKYLRFSRSPAPARKTMVWFVISQSSDVKLGEIKWHSPWRQYVFFPAPETLFNTDCLVVIADRIETLMRWRKNMRAHLGNVKNT